MRYRKLPVEVEAIRVPDFYNDHGKHKEWLAVSEWMDEHGCLAKTTYDGPMVTGWDISTLEGVMHAGYGDWIIRGVKGEFYPCRDDIFRATYEAVA